MLSYDNLDDLEGLFSMFSRGKKKENAKQIKHFVENSCREEHFLITNRTKAKLS